MNENVHDKNVFDYNNFIMSYVLLTTVTHGKVLTFFFVVVGNDILKN